MEAGSPPPTDDLIRREVRVRDEIRQLQEQRAAALEEEILALQKEREITFAKIATQQLQILELRTENDLMKSQRSDSAILVRLAKAEQELARENESNNEMRRKLKLATQHNGRLLIKVKRLENELNKRPRSQIKDHGLAVRSASLSQLSVEVEEGGVTVGNDEGTGTTRIGNGEKEEVEVCCQGCQTDDMVYRNEECQTDR